ncbi:conserved hypothetical protein [Ricinus communis]|uniref:Uncharacterized protein n=1 Tax=Ricinus communis TaxID=3988 RepID=B9RXB3_RICCO|nr:conserved hypothetical protein [Ricinus communis]
MTRMRISPLPLPLKMRKSLCRLVFVIFLVKVIQYKSTDDDDIEFETRGNMFDQHMHILDPPSRNGASKSSKSTDAPSHFIFFEVMASAP